MNIEEMVARGKLKLEASRLEAAAKETAAREKEDDAKHTLWMCVIQAVGLLFKELRNSLWIDLQFPATWSSTTTSAEVTIKAPGCTPILMYVYLEFPEEKWMPNCVSSGNKGDDFGCFCVRKLELWTADDGEPHIVAAKPHYTNDLEIALALARESQDNKLSLEKILPERVAVWDEKKKSLKRSPILGTTARFVEALRDFISEQEGGD